MDDSFISSKNSEKQIKSLAISNISSIKTNYIKSDFLIVYGDVSDGDSRRLKECMGDGSRSVTHHKVPGINLFCKWKCIIETGEWSGEFDKKIPYLICATSIQQTKNSEVEVIKLVVARYEKTSSAYSSRNQQHQMLLTSHKPNFLISIPNTPGWNKLPEIEPYYNIHTNYGDGDIQEPIFSIWTCDNIKSYKIDMLNGLGCIVVDFI